jgi:hypothetical protein
VAIFPQRYTEIFRDLPARASADFIGAYAKILNRTTSRKFIAPRRQERKENSFFFELGGLCAFARETVFPNLFFSRISNLFG